MPKQPRLTEMQLVLLSTASQREDGNLFPLAESLKDSEGRIAKAIPGLIKRGFVSEVDVGRKVPSWRDDGDRRIGAVITAEGRMAINAEEPKGSDQKAVPDAPPAAANALARKPGEIRAGTKQALLVEMLEREGGASIQEIVDATGWLSHTTRAALTGLRKRGFDITSEKVQGVSRYSAKRPA